MKRRMRREAAILKKAAEGGPQPTGRFARKLLARHATGSSANGTMSVERLTKRIAEIKAVEDYDENATLLAELSKLRKQLKDASQARANSSASTVAIEARIKEIKNIDDYDENDDLVAELRQLRKTLKSLQQNDQQQQQQREYREKRLAAITTRMSEIKAVDDYDEDEKLVAELKQLRAEKKQLASQATDQKHVNVNAQRAAEAEERKKHKMKELARTKAKEEAARKRAAEAEAAKKKAAAKAKARRRKAELEKRIQAIKQTDDYDEKPKLMQKLKACRNELRSIATQFPTISSLGPVSTPSKQVLQTPSQKRRQPDAPSNGQQVFYRNLPRDSQSIQQLLSLFRSGALRTHYNISRLQPSLRIRCPFLAFVAGFNDISANPFRNSTTSQLTGSGTITLPLTQNSTFVLSKLQNCEVVFL